MNNKVKQKSITWRELAYWLSGIIIGICATILWGRMLKVI
jgi:hypothetical protein